VPDSTLSRLDGRAVRHSALSAAAAAISWLVARWFRFPETYWAVATTLIITQSIEDANPTVSMQRLAGTALGAIVGAIMAQLDVPRTVALPVSIFLLGLLSAVLHLGKPAYRFAGIALVIVTLPPRVQPPFTIALHRFFEVAIGICVGLLLVHARLTTGSASVEHVRP
jgi:uncharacterized membrane protein YccC